MAETPQTNDPYAPPPRYKSKSGVMVRVALLAAMLAGAAWGYMSFANAPQTALVPVEEQSFAEAHAPDGSYRVNTPDLEPAITAPLPTSAAQPAAPRTSAPAPAADPVPPPSTTVEPSSTPAPLQPVDAPAGD